MEKVPIFFLKPLFPVELVRKRADSQRATMKLLTIQNRDGLLRLVFATQLNESRIIALEREAINSELDSLTTDLLVKHVIRAQLGDISNSLGRYSHINFNTVKELLDVSWCSIPRQLRDRNRPRMVPSGRGSSGCEWNFWARGRRLNDFFLDSYA